MRPCVKERAWLIKHDMLPGLNARAFRHRVIVGEDEKLCQFGAGGAQPCREEETLEHFFFLCSGAKTAFMELKRRLSNYGGFGNCEDLSLILGDVHVPKKRRKTFFWTLYTFLSWMYETRKGGHLANFESLWNKTKTDSKIVQFCHNGKWMDDTIFANI